VYGLTLHGTEVSGTTIFLPRPEILPFIDLPILGTVGDSTSDAELLRVFELAGRAAAGAVLCVELTAADMLTVRSFGGRLARQFEGRPFAVNRPLVLVVAGNVGKTLGQYATRWGQIATALVVIDEIPSRRAHFATIGQPRNGLVPISYHGLDARQ
jgi:ethanolamine utilization protein EutA